MKYLLVLLVGLGLGIGGEFLIPNKYGIEIGKGCISNHDSPNVVLMVRTQIHDRESNATYPLYLDGDAGTITSYETLYEFLSGRLGKLSESDCNKVVSAGRTEEVAIKSLWANCLENVDLNLSVKQKTAAAQACDDKFLKGPK